MAKKSTSEAVEAPLRRSSRRSTTATPGTKTQQQGNSAAESTNTPKRKSVSKTSGTKEPPKKRQKASKETDTAKQEVEPVKSANGAKYEDGITSESRQYWLLKAEPETRLENGVDVRFSIDDLAAKTEPEPWDGIRAYAARNNLRAMKKGDLAFFYHSNCKEPGIVGTMEIVEEHSPDLTAHDPKKPYYDPKSQPSDPKWSVVHVKFRSKFDVQIGLKELRTLCAPGKPLENMQMLKQSRLSVSKVSADEWHYLNELAEKKAVEVKSEGS
ncbi:DUF55-domain-containing protein [Coniochaeta ligniaria NRRL 30616]|uniref:Thymocyte nuclear protein 1 n=1 Tax=Coniochaeta ligniaria NRRL 30616 TaxID=1408157 RepID=A0A1J7JBV1_9PEZI|nr:DUF55-domain-containing protein [Coniochaeta ligniaria NRRL 30616]